MRSDLGLCLALMALGCSPQVPVEEPHTQTTTTGETTAPVEDIAPEIPTVAKGTVKALAVSRLPRFVTVVRGRVYWTNGYGELSSVPLAGGAVIVHHDPGGDRALARVIAFDKTAIYFTSKIGLHRLVAGEQKARLFIDVPDALYVTADADHLYFTRFNKAGIWRVDSHGGIPRKLVTTKLPSSLIVRGDYLYWTAYGEGTVNRVHTSTRKRTVLARSRRPTGLAVIGETIIWGSEAGGTIHIKERGKRARVLLRGARNHDVFASDSSHVYWASWQPVGKGRLSRIAIPRGREEILAEELRSPVGVAVIGDDVIVANKGEDTILRISKSSRP